MREELISNPSITPEDCKELFLIFVFDMWKQSGKLKNSVADIKMKAQYSQNEPANAQIFAVVISDKTDGNKTIVEYETFFVDFFQAKWQVIKV